MNIQNYVLDTSSAIKPFLEEEGADKVEILFQLKENFQISLLMPEIFRYEFLNTIGRLKGKKAAMEAYDLLTQKQVSIVPLSTDIELIALSLVDKYEKISFYDATFHALAMLYKVDFITSDKKYFELTKKEGNIQLLDNITHAPHPETP